jgi:hypothetical protein
MQPVYISARLLLMARAPFPWNLPAPLCLSARSCPPVHHLPPPAPNSVAAAAFTASPPSCHAPTHPPQRVEPSRLTPPPFPLTKPAHPGPFSFLRTPKPLPPIRPRRHAACRRRPPSRTRMELSQSAARPPSLSRTSSVPHQLPSPIQRRNR